MTRMYYFMLQLSVADIITAVFTMLPEVLWTLFGLPVLAPGKYRQGFHKEIKDFLVHSFKFFGKENICPICHRFYGGNFVCKGVKFGQMIGPYLR